MKRSMPLLTASPACLSCRRGALRGWFIWVPLLAKPRPSAPDAAAQLNGLSLTSRDSLLRSPAML